MQNFVLQVINTVEPWTEVKCLYTHRTKFGCTLRLVSMEPEARMSPYRWKSRLQMAALWPLMERTAMHIENMVHMDEYTSKTMLVTNTAFNQNRKTNDQQWFSKHIPTIKFWTDFFLCILSKFGLWRSLKAHRELGNVTNFCSLPGKRP